MVKSQEKQWTLFYWVGEGRKQRTEYLANHFINISTECVSCDLAFLHIYLKVYLLRKIKNLLAAFVSTMALHIVGILAIFSALLSFIFWLIY